MDAYTKEELLAMWKRPVEEQYNIAATKVLQAIVETEGDIAISFSGGKDSCLVLDLYCQLISQTKFKDKPVVVRFANTTNETNAMLQFIPFFINWCEDRYKVKIDFHELRPKGTVWAEYILEHGLPLISKQQSRYIRRAKTGMKRLGVDYDTVYRLAKKDINCVKELKAMGFTDTEVMSLTGYVSSREVFGKLFTISHKWLPMLKCEIDLDDRCCNRLKEQPLTRVAFPKIMTGEQAAENRMRERVYLANGCNVRLPDGKYVSRPLGPMTTDGILFALKFRETPICPDYGEIVCEDGHYRCTKSQRTGCALCGFGCQYDTQRFVRLQETEPAKVKFAFKPKAEGGAGYKEAIEFMNENCGTKIEIPKID